MKHLLAVFGLFFSFTSIGQDRCSQADALGEEERCLHDNSPSSVKANLPLKNGEKGWWSAVTPGLKLEDTLSASTKIMSGLVRGENVLVWVIDGEKCLMTTDTIKIRVLGQPKSPSFSITGNGLSGLNLSSGVTAHLCTDAGYFISGSGSDEDNNEEISWNVEGAARFNGEQNVPEGELEVIRPGEATICQIIDNGCFSNQSCGKLLVHSNPVALLNMPASIDVCEGNKVELKGAYSDSGEKGIWEVRKGVADLSVISDLNAETSELEKEVWFNWKVQSEFCGTQYKTVHVNVLPINVLDVILAADSVNCVGEELQIDAQVKGDSIDIKWESTWGLGSEIDNALLLKPFEMPGAYSVTATVSSDKKCSSKSVTDKIEFVVLSIEKPELVYDELEVCAPDKVTIKSNSGVVSWYRDQEKLAEGVELTVSESGRYYALPFGNECAEEKSEFVDVEILEKPDLQLEGAVSVKPGSELVLEPKSDAQDFEWSPSINLSDSIDKNPIFSTSKKGQYRYTLTARNGDCETKKSMTVKVE